MELELRLGTVPTLKIKTKSEPSVQLDLLPLTSVQRHSPPPHHFGLPCLTHAKDEPVKNGEDTKAISSPNTIARSSIFYKDFSRVGKLRNRDLENQLNIKVEIDGEGGTSLRGSDEEEENGPRKKKLRLSKEQSALLEESFKENHTLNPIQKLVLAKQLNLRSRQVEVWFQNRRARTKLKQTEADCEYLKRCCETLGEENARLQKELQELSALNHINISNSYFSATTLTLCPSCERLESSTKSNLKSKISQQNKI